MIFRLVEYEIAVPMPRDERVREPAAVPLGGGEIREVFAHLWDGQVVSDVVRGKLILGDGDVVAIFVRLFRDRGDLSNVVLREEIKVNVEVGDLEEPGRWPAGTQSIP